MSQCGFTFLQEVKDENYPDTKEEISEPAAKRPRLEEKSGEDEEEELVCHRFRLNLL